MKFYSSRKLTQSSLFRLYFIEKNNWGGGGSWKKNLRLVIGNYLTLNSPPPPPPIPKFVICLLMKPMFSVFTLAIKFDCLFLAIFWSLHWFVSFIFDKLVPPPKIYVSKDSLNHVFVHSSAKTSLRRAKNVVFFLFCILFDRPMGGALVPAYATESYCDS